MKLIDKSALVAEIKRILNAFENSDASVDRLRASTLIALLSFIDTLEVKEVDLEKEIKNGIDNLSNLYCYMEDLFNGNEEEGVYPIPEKVRNELFEFAKHFYELGLKTQKGE